MDGYSIPTPEQAQLLMGIHPLQLAANVATQQPATGAPTQAQPALPSEGQGMPQSVSPDNPSGADAVGTRQSDPPPRLISPPPVNEPRGISVAPPLDQGPAQFGSRRPIVTVKTGGPSRISRTQPESGPPAPEPGPNLAASATAPNVSALASAGATGRASIPLTPDQARTRADLARLDQLRAAPPGVVNFQQRHRIFGPLVRGLEIAGSVAAPGVLAQIPGTTLNKYANEARQANRVSEDLNIEQEKQQLADRDEMAAVHRQAEEEKNAHQDQLTKLRQEAEARQEDIRNITYNPQAQQFERAGKVYVPRNLEEATQLEIQNGVTRFDDKGNIAQAGPSTRMWQRERRNQPAPAHVQRTPQSQGGALQLSAGQQRMINALAPGMLSALARAEGQKLKWMQIGGAGSKQVKNIEAQIASIHEKLDPILHQVMQGKGVLQPARPKKSFP